MTPAKLETLSRYELQQYAKEKGIKANQSSKQLIDELTELMSEGLADESPVAAPEHEDATPSEPASSESAETEQPMEDATEALITFTPEAQPKQVAAVDAPIDVSEAVSERPEEAKEAEPEEEPAAEPMETEAAIEETPSSTDTASAVEPESTVPVVQAEAPASVPAATASTTANADTKSAHTKALEAAKRKREEDQKREEEAKERREKMAARQKERKASPQMNDAAARATMAAMEAKMPRGALPRVAMMAKAPLPRPQTSGLDDRFKTLYAMSDAPNPNAYADAALAGSKPATHVASASFDANTKDRFAGHGSRYRNGYRPSTMPIHDPKVYATKQIDEAVPLPGVASIAQPVERREVIPSNERFAVGVSGSIYNAPTDTPAVTKYETGVAMGKPDSATAFDKQCDRHAYAETSIYKASDAPAVTKYENVVAHGDLVNHEHTTAFDKQTDRHTYAEQSIYKASDAPAVTKYENVVAHGDLVKPDSTTAFDKQTDRHAYAEQSIYKTSDAPAVTKYETAVKANTSTMVNIESGYADRFEGPHGLYRKGLRTSTCPEFRDPSSFPKLPGVAPPISKAASRASKGAALRASLKATIAGATKLGALAEVSETDASLNMTEAQ
jgi:hypothetical protein